MDPSSPEQWLAVAKARRIEAEIINKHSPDSVGAVYLAGYMVECSLKAFLQKQNTGFPKFGSEGHNLRQLWRACKFRLADLDDYNGSKAFFIDSWQTDLRYQTKLDSTLTSEELIQGAKQLAGWIKLQIKRQRKNK